MLHILDASFPFFALVLIGWACARGGWLPLESIPALNLFVLYFALPCMLLRFAASTPIGKLFDPLVFGIWLACALVMVGLAVASARCRSTDWNNAAFGALVAAFANSGFMGVPLLADLLGPGAAAPAIVTLAIDMVITSSLCIALSRLGETGAHGMRPAVAKALRGMLVNPLPWAIGAGCLLSASGWVPPRMAMKPIAMLADAASPAAMFTLGAVLARSQRAAGRSQAAAGMRRGDVPLLATLKLIVHPLVVFAAGRAAIAMGRPLEPFTATVLVLVAALPSASNVPMLAERFGADAARIARVVMTTTVLAFASFMGAARLLGY